MIDMDLVKLEAKKELARREFFYFCNLLAPDFYKKDREYLKELCDEMQDFYHSDDDVLVSDMVKHEEEKTGVKIVLMPYSCELDE